MRENTYLRKGALLLAAVLFLGCLAAPAQASTWDADGNEIMIIVLDPGHGGWDGGAVGVHNGVEAVERDLCWKIANYCKDYLEENYWNVRVYMTREEDENPKLVDRVNYARDLGADFFLSFHLNATEEGTATGAYALVPRGRYRPEQAQVTHDVANAILNKLEDLGIRDRGFLIQTTTSNTYPDGSWWDAFDIVRYCVNRNIPGFIMEHAFVDNYSDYINFLSSDEKLQRIGIADALGLAQELGLEEFSEEPEPTEPEPTEPEPTEPEPTEPEPTEPEPVELPFEDVSEGEWFYDDVAYAYSHGLINGVSDTLFQPYAAASRAMVVTMLSRIDGGSAQPEEPTFADVEPGAWYYEAVEWAVETGVARGVTETEFAPNRPVTREQFVTFLHRYAGILGYDITAGDALDGYADQESVGGYAREPMAWAVEQGIVNGYDDDTLKPLRELNRAELAAMIRRFHEFLGADAPAEEVWEINHTDVTIAIGESFYLKVRNENGETADIDWQPSKDGYVTISGNKITGEAKGTVTVRGTWNGEEYSCIVRVRTSW